MGTALSGDIVDSAGNVIPSAYVSMAAQMSTEAGIAYRYGPDPSFYGTTGNTGLPTWYLRPSQTASIASKFGIVPGMLYQGGTLSQDPGNFSSNQGNAIFVADDPSTSTGVADIGISDVVYNTYDEMPGVSWTRWDHGLEDDNAVYYKSQGLKATSPTAIGRCNGEAGACPTGIVVFQSGLIGVYAGSNTANNQTTAQLDAGKVPTGVALTNDGEFALITV